MSHRRIREHGGSKVSMLFWLAVMAAVIYALVNAGPVYFADFQLKDELQEICRMGRSRQGDGPVRERVQSAIRDNGLTGYLNPGSCKIVTVTTSRSISCTYEREVRWLPGYTRMQRFTPSAKAMIL